MKKYCYQFFYTKRYILHYLFFYLQTICISSDQLSVIKKKINVIWITFAFIKIGNKYDIKNKLSIFLLI